MDKVGLWSATTLRRIFEEFKHVSILSLLQIVLISSQQSFHPRKELLPFYRYIRIDFLSYYGAEYFCPVSLLRVYGLTQMEEWKSDVWKAEWEASRGDVGTISEPSVITLEGRPTSSTTNDSAVTNNTESLAITRETTPPNSADPSSTELTEAKAPHTPILEHVVLATPDISIVGTSITTTAAVKEDQAVPLENVHTAPPTRSTPSTSDLSREANEPVIRPVNGHFDAPQSTEAENTTREASSASLTSVEAHTTSSTTSTSTSISGAPIESPQTIIRTVSTTIVLSAATPSASPSSVIPSGESIYRMIINRLNVLEANQTLYAKYLEEQGRMVNIRMERLEEDIGRLGGIVSRRLCRQYFWLTATQVTSQQQHVSKMLQVHRNELKYKQDQLAQQVESLAHEVCCRVEYATNCLIFLSRS
jgi:hypothetical protein